MQTDFATLIERNRLEKARLERIGRYVVDAIRNKIEANYIITYDLNREGPGYPTARRAVIEAICSLGKATRLTTTTWLLQSPKNFRVVYGTIVEASDANDNIVIYSTSMKHGLAQVGGRRFRIAAPD